MSDQERTATALALAFFFHFILLRLDIMEKSPPRTTALVTVTLTSLPSPESGHQPGLSLTAQPQADPEARAADMRRKAFLHYLETISQEVHSRRLESGNLDLIGVATYTFQVDATGEFSHITLAHSSGKAALDAAAKRAIERSSGVIKRPPILGAEPLPVVLEIKYQHNLH